MPAKGNGWKEHQLMVLSQLEDLRAAILSGHAEIANLREAVAALRVWAGIWGGAIGAGASAVVGLLLK